MWHGWLVQPCSGTASKLAVAQPRELSNDERKRIAEEDYEHWFESAGRFYDCHEYALGRNDLNESAFLLHQTTERFYAAFLLVHTGYKPKFHDIEKLGKLAAAPPPPPPAGKP